MAEIGSVTVAVSVEPTEEFDTVARALGYVKERACRAEQDYEAMDDGIPDCRIWRCECGEKLPFWRGLKPIYCPLCGAKVVEE